MLDRYKTKAYLGTKRMVMERWLEHYRCLGNKTLFLPEYAADKLGKKCTYNELADSLQLELLSGLWKE